MGCVNSTNKDSAKSIAHVSRPEYEEEEDEDEFEKDQIFISYTWADGGEHAKAIQEHLTKKGFKVWIDEAELNAAQPLKKDIKNALESSDAILVLMTKKYHEKVNRGKKTNQADAAWEFDQIVQKKGAIIIFDSELKDTSSWSENIKPGWKRKLYINFVEGTKEEKISRLDSNVEALLGY